MNRLLFAMLTLSATAGCFVVHERSSGNAEQPADGEETAPDQAACGGTESGLPAAVEAMLTARCQGCHGADTKTPVSLLGYDDLVATSADDDSQTVADRILERIQSSAAPMPPSKNGPSVPQAEIDALAAWIDAGMPRSEDTCGAGEVRAECTSGEHWTLSGVQQADEDEEENGTGPRMNPGMACIGCHQETEGKAILQLGGTLYPTGHEQDLCYGTQDATVIIVDANGDEHPLQVFDTGNFAVSTDDAAIPFPITAKVVDADGNERIMETPQESGDCNACHTQAGDHGAPGRIFLPERP